MFCRVTPPTEFEASMPFEPGATAGGVSKPDVQPELTATAASDPSRWVDEHGDFLYRYALERVRKPDIA